MTKSKSALDMFQRGPENFDLVITDVTMPGMNGVDLARNILRIRPNLPIILSTGYGEVMNANKATILGARDYLMKPIIRADLARAVRKVLDVIDGR